ncbi:MAG: TRAP transporter small permease [Gemmobacter sp.]|nr:TRAP transporter small permease [Gemmobacter sp.]
MSADVVMRNVFGKPLVGTIEIVSIIYMIGICFLPLALADERDAHISVEVLTELMPRRVVHILLIVGTVLGIVVMGALCWRTWAEAMTQMRKGSVMITSGKEPMLTWPSYYILPVGFGLSFMVLIYKLLCLLTNREFGPDADDLPAGMELVVKESADHV